MARGELRKDCMNIEDRFFTRARLGRHWSEPAAETCLLFFPAHYHFDPNRERQFMATHQTDYSDHLKLWLESAEHHIENAARAAKQTHEQSP